MVKRVTAYEDSKGIIHASKDEAEAAERQYLGDVRFDELIQELKKIALEFEILNVGDSDSVASKLMDIVSDYTLDDDDDFDSSYDSSF
jgi:hypothetical protein